MANTMDDNKNLSSISDSWEIVAPATVTMANSTDDNKNLSSLLSSLGVDLSEFERDPKLRSQMNLLPSLLAQRGEKEGLSQWFSNIADQYDNQGKYEKALEWYQTALHHKETTVGKEGPSTLTIVHNMADVYDHQGNEAKALEFYQRALQGYETALGRDHVAIADIVTNIARLYIKQGNYEKALEFYQKVPEGAAALAKEDPGILNILHNKGYQCAQSRNYEKD